MSQKTSSLHPKSTKCANASVHEYYDEIIKKATILKDMGFALPAWQVSTFYRLGLHGNRKPQAALVEKPPVNCSTTRHQS